MSKLALALAAYMLATPVLAQEVLVIDGDTFELDGEVMRLWGIDAPELDQTCVLDGELVPAGNDAKLWLRDFLRHLDHCDEIELDQYGRTFARCYRYTGGDLREINETMVLLGLAWAHPSYSHGVYQSAQDFAQARSLGIWRWGCIPPWEWRAERQQP